MVSPIGGSGFIPPQGSGSVNSQYRNEYNNAFNEYLKDPDSLQKLEKVLNILHN